MIGLVAGRVQIETLVARPDRADHGERGEVDAVRVELGGQGGLDEGVDHRLVRRDEQDPQHPPASLVDLAQRVEVQHGLVRRHRDELLDLEAEGVAKLLLGQPGQRDLADDDPLVADAEVDLLALDPGLAPQLAERLGDDLGLADLARLDGAGRQRHLGGANDHRDVAGGDLGHADGGRADVHADPRPGHYAPSTWTDRSER